MRRANEADGGHAVAEDRTPPGQLSMIVLQPTSPPGLADIRIDGSLFAVGRAEAPFTSYPVEVIADLSRRHARIFCEGGAVYLADLDSKNGTTVNGAAVTRTIRRLRDGDDIGFGRALSYRLKLVEGGPAPAPAATLASLTLTPESPDSGLQPIVVTEFPFLISKANDAFARHQASAPEQVNYLSRHHAHIFLKNGRPFIEDLGSTNGTFVDGTRLDEHAVALAEGSTVAFGGHHFVYRLGTQWDDPTIDPTVTRYGRAPATPVVDADKTTFVAAADSFLDIFCVDPPQEAPGDEAAKAPAAEAVPARGQSKAAAFVAELRTAIGSEGMRKQPAIRLGLMALAALVIVTLSLYMTGAPEREARDLLDDGKYTRAAAVATDGLARDPDNLALRNLATQAQLKANVPLWCALIKARQYDRAAALVATMRQGARRNAELQPLLNELAWVGDIEQFVSERGGAEAAPGSPADAARIKQILKQWDEDTETHQRAFSTISSYVPAFRDTYAVTLSHVRKLALSGGGPANEQQSP